ncbi:hypothetical protein SAMN05216266_114203 [Amycolatopsis marina]|uniref:Uncharacterized protein n=1 Tax=Amycolatopsis marina TaxID=490629 RepID=A0A1I1BQ33_9PSEU|nr:hypothetical protein SAMN05216266_114203 [Amycolatopsis marina]
MDQAGDNTGDAVIEGRSAALAIVSALVLVVAGSGPAFAGERALPPKLDVAAAIQALEREQIHRAPGAIATYDEELIRAELTPDVRVLVSPYSGEIDAAGNYATHDEHSEQVTRPLRKWAEESGVTLVHVEGLSVRSRKGMAVPDTGEELRQFLGHLDVTDALWTMLRYIKDGTEPDENVAAIDPVVEPTRQQVDELAVRLERERVHNAADRADPIDLPLALIEEKTGFTLRVAALPAVPRGEPLVDYAPALAERFPHDVVLVAHGPWLEVAGPQQIALSAARDYAYGRYQRATLRLGIVMRDRIGTVLLRAEELLENRAFSRPQPKPLRQVIMDIAPWVLLGSTLLIGGASLLRWGVRRVELARTERADVRDASAETYADIARLGDLLLRSEGDAAAAERHSTAVTLFEQARTAEAMAEVRKVVHEGLEWQRNTDRSERKGTP